VNGWGAVQAVEREEFGVVLMDIQMPEMVGFEATGATREKERGTSRHTPIVAMTAHALKGDEDRCLDSGMAADIFNPIRSSQLYEIPEHILDAR
jgi:CheY-like chemotaxis protein